MKENNTKEILTVFSEELRVINLELSETYLKNSSIRFKNLEKYVINSAAYKMAEYSGERIVELGNKAIELYEKTVKYYDLEIIDDTFINGVINIVENLLKQICSGARRSIVQYAASCGMEHILNIKTYQINNVLENKIPPLIKKLEIITKKHNLLYNSISKNNKTDETMNKNNNKFIELINRYKNLLENSTYENRYKGDYETLKIESEHLIESLFGKDELKRFKGLPKVRAIVLGVQKNYTKELNDYKEEISKIIDKLEGYKNITNEKNNKNVNNKTEINFDKIFIVHGHNETMKQSVARLIEKQNIDAIILHEKPNKGRTIIEKFESNSDVNSAIVLFTGDDFGYSKGENNSKAKLRPRQNVIFEMGYFFGKLGREKVICLFDDNIDIEIFSDYKGIIYIPYDSNGSWKYELGKELQEIGFNFDLNKIK